MDGGFCLVEFLCAFFLEFLDLGGSFLVEFVRLFLGCFRKFLCFHFQVIRCFGHILFEFFCLGIGVIPGILSLFFLAGGEGEGSDGGNDEEGFKFHGYQITYFFGNYNFLLRDKFLKIRK